MDVLRALGGAARQARLDAGLRQIDIAAAAKVSHGTISRFETSGRAEDQEAIVRAYEAECEFEAGTLWRRAVEREST